MVEQFRDIEGYGGQYKVSNLGNVLAAESYVILNGKRIRRKEKVLKTACNGRGYRYVTISVNRERKNYYVHRLVAQAWIPNPSGLKEVNHKDFNKANNDYRNLEWVSSAENKKHYSNSNRGKLGNSPLARKVINVATGEILGCAKLIPNIYYKTLTDGLRKHLSYHGWSYRVELFRRCKAAALYCMLKKRKIGKAITEIVPYPNGYNKKTSDKELIGYFSRQAIEIGLSISRLKD